MKNLAKNFHVRLHVRRVYHHVRHTHPLLVIVIPVYCFAYSILVFFHVRQMLSEFRRLQSNFCVLQRTTSPQKPFYNYFISPPLPKKD